MNIKIITEKLRRWLNNRQLLTLAGCIVELFPVLLWYLDYYTGWDWGTLTYHRYWSLQGTSRPYIQLAF